jgi:enamine deaminase RidA (YjgF/YER057c/UK114 family)
LRQEVNTMSHNPPSSRQDALDSVIRRLGHSFEGEIRIGGNYVPVVHERGTAWISGQVPRVGDSVVVTGRVGGEVTLAQARHAAEICAVRALLLLRQSLGDLEAVSRVLRVGVFTQCTDDFTQLSEVADAASDLLHEVFGDAGRHARTSVGVYQLPKNASVELEMMVATHER